MTYILGRLLKKKTYIPSIPRRKQESFARDLQDEIKPTFVGLLCLPS